MATGVAFAVQSIFRAASPFAARSPFGDMVFNEGVLSDSEFYAPLTHSLTLTRGTGNPTYSRATAAWEFDNEGKLITVPSGAARFGGARMVRNLFSKSENFSSGWLLLGASASNNGNGSFTITASAGTYAGGIYELVGVVGGTMCVTVRVSKGSHRYIGIRAGQYLTGSPEKIPYYDFDTDTLNNIIVGATLERSIVSPGVIDLTLVAPNISNTTIQIWMTANDGSVLTAKTGGETCVLWRAQLENVTGQADQTASEYVSVGVLSAPYHGAGIDGVKYFNTNKDGSAISAATLLGYHAEGARTNSLLYSRDLTNAAWVKTNVTAAKTATGIDNAANSASTITAAAANATILQTLALASAARSSSAYVKRRTGTGTISFTRNGGTTWTDITSQINNSTWTRVKIENSSVLNPSIGFLLATSGDAIDVDVVQDEAGIFCSSPIITTTAAVTRNADALYYPITSNFNDAAGASIASVVWTGWNSGQPSRSIDLSNNRSFCPNLNSASGTTQIWDGTNTLNNLQANPLGTPVKVGASWVLGGNKKAVMAGGAIASNAYDGSFTEGTATTIRPGGIDGIGTLFGYIKETHIWQSALTDAQLQQVTA